METERIALLPRFFLLLVPSRLIKVWSRAVCLVGSRPTIALAIMVLTLVTAFKTPRPLNLVLSLSLNSTASYFPVEAPEGIAADA